MTHLPIVVDPTTAPDTLAVKPWLSPPRDRGGRLWWVHNQPEKA
jgi:hypothetical protein